MIDRDGQPGVVDSTGAWLLVGNTCDLDRDLGSVRWTQVPPLLSFPTAEIESDELAALRGYQYSRRFYLPPWPGAPGDRQHVADLTCLVALHREALTKTTVIARLSRISWILLHCALVRFLARDDGRFDA